ncbi:MAG: sulfite exporter TauE/SafE family protein [Pseudomonadota bacterium]
MAARFGVCYASGMDFTLLSQIDTFVLVAAFLVAVLSGVIKGAIGFGMPLVILSGLSTFLDPKLALAGMMAPIVVSNALQAFRTGIAPAIAATRIAWRYMLIVCIMIFAAAQLVPSIPSEAFYFVLGIPVLTLALIQLMGLRLIIPLRHRGWAEWAVGLISGVLGGLAGTWGPTTVLYLLAIDMPKARQVIVQGMIYGTGSITLLFAHLRSGILNAETIPFTLALLPTAVLGMWIGFQIQDRLDQEKFRKLTLIVIVLAALNLLRKGLAL